MKTGNITLAIRVDDKWQWKTVITLILVALLIFLIIYSVIAIRTNSQFDIYYSLNTRHNDQELIKVIDSAQDYIYFAIYFFTKNSIADALVRAKRRGVNVMGIMDRDASKNSNLKILEKLQAAKIYVLTQKHLEGIMHIKALVTEKAYVSGSYNWTDSATNVNDEILEIGTNQSVRKQYLEIIKKLLLVNN